MEEFGWSRTDATLYMSIQPWVAAICTPFAGKLISRFNPRWVMTAAAAVFGLASLACAWFTEPWQWNVYGVLYGASAAFWMYIATRRSSTVGSLRATAPSSASSACARRCWARS